MHEIFMEKGGYIMQRTLLRNMFLTFEESLNFTENKKLLTQNYEKQLKSYAKLFDESGEGEAQRRNLICARCLASATRSLLSGGYLSENIPTVKNEISRLSPVFRGERMAKKDIAALIDERINRLASKKSDEMTDAVLFMCISLSNKSHAEEKSLD